MDVRNEILTQMVSKGEHWIDRGCLIENLLKFLQDHSITGVSIIPEMSNTDECAFSVNFICNLRVNFFHNLYSLNVHTCLYTPSHFFETSLINTKGKIIFVKSLGYGSDGGKFATMDEVLQEIRSLA
jgi:hypothetical protein